MTSKVLLVGDPRVVEAHSFPRVSLEDAATELLRQLPDIVVLDGRPLSRELLGVVRRLRQLKSSTTTLAICADLLPRSAVEACYESGADFVVFGTFDLPMLLTSSELTPPTAALPLNLHTSGGHSVRNHLLEAVGQLAAGLAHELNNQLTAILGFNELLGMQLGPAANDLTRYVKQIDIAAEESRQLVAQLLAFGRRQVMNPQLLKVDRLLEGVVETLSRDVPDTIKLEHHTDEDTQRIRGDRAQLKNVLLCLADSAVKAMPDGGTIRLVASNVEISVKEADPDLGFLPGSYVRLGVLDTGESLSNEAAERIFEPFFSRSARHAKGLGLSAVYGIVKQSGGWIWVKPGSRSTGTEFQLFFPSEQKAETTRRLGNSGEIGTREPGQRRVLVVEDQDSVRTYARDVFAGAGFHVTEAACGEEGLELVEQNPKRFDLILTDVAMPGMGGRQFADRARQVAPQRILFMSGHPGNALVECGLLRDGERFLSKPFSAKELIAEAEEALAHGTAGWKVDDDTDAKTATAT